ncbi:MAG: c-type cytochrome [Planctomycetota bacterium]
MNDQGQLESASSDDVLLQPWAGAEPPLPGWWRRILLATIAMIPLYMIYFHGGAEGRSTVDSYERALSKNLERQFAEIGELTPSRDTLVRFQEKTNWLQVGKMTFKRNCISCHGKDGGGSVGPNLCDDHYKNVRSIEDLIDVIQNGAAAGAMPAWKTKLSGNELVLTAAYVASLRGSEPETAKAPEGSPIPPWPLVVETVEEKDSAAETSAP